MDDEKKIRKELQDIKLIENNTFWMPFIVNQNAI